ncbi:hypothetical protein C7212DRAFT_334390, partial [Tuber magnatum]
MLTLNKWSWRDVYSSTSTNTIPDPVGKPPSTDFLGILPLREQVTMREQGLLVPNNDPHKPGLPLNSR